MPFIFPNKNEPSALSSKTKDELFEIYMLEIGQYTKDELGNIYITWPLIKSSTIAENFKDWMKKKNIL